MEPSHLKFALSLTEKEHWGTTIQELEDLYFYSSKGKYIVLNHTTPIATIFGTDYGTFGFIGNLIVKKEFRGQGIGKALLELIIEEFHHSENKPILLDAVPNAVPFYESLGFKSLYRSLRYRGTYLNTPKNNFDQIQPIDASHWEEIVEFDQRSFGAPREYLLQSLFKQNPEMCYFKRSNEKVSGYIMLSPRQGYIKIGPWVCDPKESHPEYLLFHALRELTPVDIYLGVLESNKISHQLMEDLSIPLAFHSIRMVYGSFQNDFPSVFALAGPDRG